MNRVIVFVVMVVMLLTTTAVRAQDPITLVIQQGITKVIKAVDLKIQRLQNRTIWLQNAQKVLENTMSKLQLDQISDWVEKQRTLYQDYFNELWEVKSLLTYYHKVRDITQRQLLLVQEYKRAWNGVRQDKHFTAEEILYIGNVYTGIIEESLKNLEQVALVINSFATQMTDAKRMELIDTAAAGLEKNYQDLKAFNTQNVTLSLQRANGAADIAAVRALYGIQGE